MMPSPPVARWLIIAALIVLWEALPRFGAISPLFLPPLSDTLRVVVADWPQYAEALVVTLGDETETFEPPRHKDIDEQQVVDLRRMLKHAGYTPAEGNGPVGEAGT